MKTTMQSRCARSSAVAAAALLAFWFTFGGSQVVRAEDAEILSPPGQDMVWVPAKTVEALEQRVISLEETVAALTESWQHIDTHRLCVSDDSGAAETCITKPQLDALLILFAQAEISHAPASQEASAGPPAEPVEIAAAMQMLPSSEPTIVLGKNLLPDQEPESTGTVKPASAGSSSGAAVLSYPEVEIYREPAVGSDE